MTTPTVIISPILNGQQFFDNNSNLLSGGQLFQYQAGSSSVQQSTYTTSSGTIANANPIILNSSGRLTQEIWLDITKTYHFVLTLADGVTVIGSWDNIGESYVLASVVLNTATTNNSATTVQTQLNNIGSNTGSTYIGFTPSGAGAVATTTSAKLQQTVSVIDFGASVSASASANVTAFQEALNYINSIGGGIVFVPPGQYNLNAALNIYKKTILQGCGIASALIFSHAGDGIDSTWPINSSTGVWIQVRDIALYNTNGSNTGGGFVDVGGTFVDLFNVYLNGWAYGIIFDQTEIASITQCELVSCTSAGVWLVNGADHTISAAANYTNKITVKNCQFNLLAGTINGVQDDGGTNHSFMDNNFQGCNYSIRVAGVIGLTILNNEIEGTNTYCVYLAETKVSAGYVGACASLLIAANTMGTSGGSCIYIDQVNSGTIQNNTFSQFSVAAIGCNFGPNA